MASRRRPGKIDALRASIAALHGKAGAAGTGLIVLTTGGKMSAYGPGSRFGVIHDAFGVKPAAAGLSVSNHGQAISYEFIAQTDPDWLFVIDRDAAIGREGSPARSMLDNALIRPTKAWKNGRVVYLNNQLVPAGQRRSGCHAAERGRGRPRWPGRSRGMAGSRALCGCR